MTGKRKSKRAVAMSQTMKVIRNVHPGMAQTQVLSMASKQLSERNKNGVLTGLIGAKMFGHGLSMAPPRRTGMYLKPYR